MMNIAIYKLSAKGISHIGNQLIDAESARFCEHKVVVRAKHNSNKKQKSYRMLLLLDQDLVIRDVLDPVMTGKFPDSYYTIDKTVDIKDIKAGYDDLNQIVDNEDLIASGFSEIPEDEPNFDLPWSRRGRSVYNNNGKLVTTLGPAGPIQSSKARMRLEALADFIVQGANRDL